MGKGEERGIEHATGSMMKNKGWVQKVRRDTE